jgi:excisionase family DNA binding protein
MTGKPLTTGEVADFCHVTYRTVLKWVEEGKLKAYRTPGNHSRIDSNDFIEFLKKYNMPIPPEFREKQGQKKILIVDDDKNMANSIKRVLRNSADYDIELAYNGFDAGRKFIGFDPDLVILDIRMPGLDGYEVAKNIKETSSNHRVKIIAVSAFFEEEGKNRIMKTGADCCLDKPFSPQILIEKVQELLA